MGSCWILRDHTFIRLVEYHWTLEPDVAATSLSRGDCHVYRFRKRLLEIMTIVIRIACQNFSRRIHTVLHLRPLIGSSMCVVTSTHSPMICSHWPMTQRMLSFWAEGCRDGDSLHAYLRFSPSSSRSHRYDHQEDEMPYVLGGARIFQFLEVSAFDFRLGRYIHGDHGTSISTAYTSTVYC